MSKPEPASAAEPIPVLLRLSFSHYCRKVEACLRQAGLTYTTLDIGLRDFPMPVGAGTVPVLRLGDVVLSDSEDIVSWADANAAPGTIPLRAQDPEVQAWSKWADEEIGPVARRQAYRCIYNAPGAFTRNPLLWAVLRLWRPMILQVLKAYTVRRFDDHDAKAGPEIIARIAAGLEATGTGYLVGDHPTAADHAVANLAEPLVRVGSWVGLDAEPGWAAVQQFVRANRTRAKKRGRRPRSDEFASWPTFQAPVQS